MRGGKNLSSKIFILIYFSVITLLLGISVFLILSANYVLIKSSCIFLLLREANFPGIQSISFSVPPLLYAPAIVDVSIRSPSRYSRCCIVSLDLLLNITGAGCFGILYLPSNTRARPFREFSGIKKKRLDDAIR